VKDHNIVGVKVGRTDSLAKALGSAKYAGDMVLSRMLYGKILRSPHAHARIISIDTSRAEKLPGVKAVVTGKDTAGVKWGIFKQTRDQYLLAIDKVRYAGEEVAAVAAVDEDTAEEALDLIKVEYEVLASVLDPIEAMSKGAPQIHDQAEQNIGMRAFMDFGDVEEGFKKADYVYEDRFVTSKISHVQMEPYAVLASYDASGKLDMWIPNQSPFTKRRSLSNVLEMPLSKIRVHHINIGGAFGGRSDPSPAEFCAALLSIKTGRPVRITYSREETMAATRHKHGAIVDLKLGVKKDGTLLAKDVKIVLDGGAYLSSGVIAAYYPYAISEAIYGIPNYRYESLRVYTNKTPCSMHRTHGSQLVRAEEVLIDRIARDLGIDPVEIRLKHAVKAGETLPSQSKVTSFALSETIEKAVAASGWKGKKGKLGEGRGIGMACGSALTAGQYIGFRMNSSAYIKFNEDGSATLFSGNVDNGQGNESIMVQVAAEELGLPMEDIALVCADTELTPQDAGSYIMQAAFCSANAVRLAASDAKQQIKKIAAPRLGVEPKNLELKDRRVYVEGNPQKGMPIADVVRFSLLEGNAVLGRASYTPKAMSKVGWSYWTPGVVNVEGQQGAAYTDGTTVVEVKVDKETGQVKVLNMWLAYDCGFAINPMAVESQWEGEAIQMLGETLFEKLEWNEKGGELITRSFLDYKIPTALDAPTNIKNIIVESVDPKGPYGAKEAGLCGGQGVEAAIANAIYDAIGVEVKEAPVTPEAILRALEEKDKATTD